MLYKVLSIAASVVLGAMTIAFVASLVFTLSSPGASLGFSQVQRAVEEMVLTSTQAMDSGFSLNVPAEPQASHEGAGEAVPSASSQPDPYGMWRSAVADPLDKVFLGSGVDFAMVEGAAAGSASALAALVGCGPDSFSSLGASAAAYAAGAGANVVPTGLPDIARIEMIQANMAAGEFGDAVVDAAGAAGRAFGGEEAALAELAEACLRATGALGRVTGYLEAADAAMGL